MEGSCNRHQFLYADVKLSGGTFTCLCFGWAEDSISSDLLQTLCRWTVSPWLAGITELLSKHFSELHILHFDSPLSQGEEADYLKSFSNLKWQTFPCLSSSVRIFSSFHLPCFKLNISVFFLLVKQKRN